MNFSLLSGDTSESHSTFFAICFFKSEKDIRLVIYDSELIPRCYTLLVVLLQLQLSQHQPVISIHWCESYTTPYNENPFPGEIPMMMSTTMAEIPPSVSLWG